VVLSDKQYYYEIIGTGMDQFGLTMNFLGIKQVSIINFILKIHFLNDFLGFLNCLDCAPKTEKCRGFRVRNPRLSAQSHRMVGLFLNNSGAHMGKYVCEWVSRDSGRPIRNPGLRS
jgi:hypothetical protein